VRRTASDEKAPPRTFHPKTPGAGGGPGLIVCIGVVPDFFGLPAFVKALFAIWYIIGLKANLEIEFGLTLRSGRFSMHGVAPPASFTLLRWRQMSGASAHYRCRALPMKILGALMATGLLVSPAVALDGELVTNDAFPFVVKIRAVYTKPTGSFEICTATVLEPRLILTAAHCISKPSPGADGPDSFVPNISKDITVYYTDAGGQARTAKSKSTFYDRAFLSNRFKYTRMMPKQVNEEARAKFLKSLSPSENEMVRKLSGTYIMADVAYIVPDHRIELKAYPRFIFDDFRPEQYLDDSGKWLTISNDKVLAITDAFLASLPSPFTRVDATFVGFGLSQCTDKELPNTCGVIDLKKRWTTLRLSYPLSWRWQSFHDSPIMTNKIADVEFPQVPPWFWIFTKKETDKWNPLNKGDSGGPVLFSKNGEWIVSASTASSASK
jgi:hypothetical protein